MGDFGLDEHEKEYSLLNLVLEKQDMECSLLQEQAIDCSLLNFVLQEQQIECSLLNSVLQEQQIECSLLNFVLQEHKSSRICAKNRRNAASVQPTQRIDAGPGRQLARLRGGTGGGMILG